MTDTPFRSVFKESLLNEQLQRDGIVKFSLKEGFSATACDQFLRGKLEKYPDELEHAFYGSVSIGELETKKEIHRDISQNLLGPYFEELLQDHRVLTYCFLVKGLGDKSILKLHQDWSIVDERKYRNYNLWVPLVDSTKENGPLYALKGSHHFPLNIRGGGIPHKYSQCFESAKEHMEAIEVMTGEALLFDVRLLHYSPPNHSQYPRTAIINNVIPSEAHVIQYHGQKEGGELIVNEYDVPEDFFIHYDNFPIEKDQPSTKATFKATIDYADAGLVTPEDFDKLLKKYILKKKKKWYSFLKL